MKNPWLMFVVGVVLGVVFAAQLRALAGKTA